MALYSAGPLNLLCPRISACRLSDLGYFPCMKYSLRYLDIGAANYVWVSHIVNSGTGVRPSRSC